MKRLLLASVAVAAIAVSSAEVALSADMSPVYKAPAPVLARDLWTGFYAGVHVGGAWGTKGFYDPTFPDALNLSDTVNGLLGGVQAGYNKQIGWIVIGVEGEFSGADVKGRSNGFNTKVDWMASVAGRIGGTVDHALIYVKGGAAWVHDKYKIAEFSENGPNGAFQTASYTRIGALFGAGIEYALPERWSAKIEYNYIDFGSKTFRACGPIFGCDDFGVRQNMHVVKAGLNRRF